MGSGIIFYSSGMEHILQFNNLSAFPKLVHGVSTAQLGNMSFNWGEPHEVVQNRQNFFAKLGVPGDQVVVASLLHGHTIAEITASDRGKGVKSGESTVEADILVTNQPDTYLFLLVADCLALLFFEPVTGVCALAHAGWRGVDQEVPKRTVEYMVKHYQCDPSNILVGFSPAIQPASFTDPVAVVTQAHDERLARWRPYLQEVNGNYQIDFVGFAYDQLLHSGVPAKNIINDRVNTRTNPDYFSFRRSNQDGDAQGRFGALIGLRA